MSRLVSNIGSAGKTGGVTARGEDGQQIDLTQFLRERVASRLMLTQFMTREGEEGETVSMMEVRDGSIKKDKVTEKWTEMFLIAFLISREQTRKKLKSLVIIHSHVITASRLDT